jgi:hypothetical protein
MGVEQKKNVDYRILQEEMTEWLKVADCKSVRFSYVGSNPTFFKTKKIINFILVLEY